MAVAVVEVEVEVEVELMVSGGDETDELPGRQLK